MKSFFAALALACAAAGFAAPSMAQNSFTLKVGSILDPQHPVIVGARRMAEIAEKESNGRLKINIFPSSQLGDQREIWQSVQAGAVDGVFEATANLANFVPAFSVLDLPYLAKDEASAFRLLNSQVIKDELDRPAQAAGFHMVNYWEVTFRDIYTRSKVVNAASDLKGLKIRVIPNPSYIALFRALGTAPTPMSYGEIYTSLQQGVIDGAENDTVTYLTSKHYEVAPRLAVTNHMMLVIPFVVSERTWKKLPPDLQAILEKAAAEGQKVAYAERVKSNERALQDLTAKGVAISHPDLAPFIAAGKKTYDQMAGKIGKDLVERVVGAVK